MTEPGIPRPARQSIPARSPAKERSAAFPLLLALVALGLACGPPIRRPALLLVWNASGSSPRGLYRVASTGIPRRGDMVVAWPPRWARTLAARRRYLPAGVPLVKQVAGVAGARVCAGGRRVLVDGRLAALRRPRDPAGRPMPSWSGCRRLHAGELFLLSEGVPLAFDGRYFGVTRSADVIGRARLVWPR